MALTKKKKKACSSSYEAWASGYRVHVRSFHYVKQLPDVFMFRTFNSTQLGCTYKPLRFALGTSHLHVCAAAISSTLPFKQWPLHIHCHPFHLHTEATETTVWIINTNKNHKGSLLLARRIKSTGKELSDSMNKQRMRDYSSLLWALKAVFGFYNGILPIRHL